MNKRIGIVLLCALASACEERPTPPPPNAKPPTAPGQADPAVTQPAEAVRPTTQALLTGPRTVLALDAVPFTLSVPEGWSLQTIAGLVVVTGPSPSGDVTIQLNSRSIQKDAIPFVEEGAKKEQASDPANQLLAESRTIGDLKVFERQWLGRAQQDGQPRTLRWTISTYVPRNPMTFSVYELNFVGLTETQLQQDREFLYSIVNTLKYDPNKEPKK
jgi:hypothetical protein